MLTLYTKYTISEVHPSNVIEQRRQHMLIFITRGGVMSDIAKPLAPRAFRCFETADWHR